MAACFSFLPHYQLEILSLLYTVYVSHMDIFFQ